MIGYESVSYLLHNLSGSNSRVFHSFLNCLGNRISHSVLGHTAVMIVETILIKDHPSLLIVGQPDRTLERRFESAAPRNILDE